MRQPGRHRVSGPPAWLLQKSWRSVVGQGQDHPSSSASSSLPHLNEVHGSSSTSCSPRPSYSPHYSTPHSSSLHHSSSPPLATAASRKRMWAMGRGVTCLGFILFALSTLESEWGQQVKASGELQLLINPLWVTCPHKRCQSTRLDQGIYIATLALIIFLVLVVVVSLSRPGLPLLRYITAFLNFLIAILLMLCAVLVGDMTHGLFGPTVMQYTWPFYCVWLDAFVFLIAGFLCLFSHGDPRLCCKLPDCQTLSVDLDPRHSGKSRFSFPNHRMTPRVTGNSPHRLSVSSPGWRNPRTSPLSTISGPHSDIPKVSI
ncbi:uncharacterized protein LOC114808238 isoform X1 [Ornithorhynchus anatinus]|uniref:uncharacterized protein LOC114808238 isoform X1 n=1 Tax=Ornithorhynchus anatinus TaxID=9258 RepID=UPI0010A7B241|nr:uncharacterized protein LOC114808238 isoform X1 [Ornithorhynchus anatinus]